MGVCRKIPPVITGGEVAVNALISKGCPLNFIFPGIMVRKIHFTSGETFRY